MTLFQINRISIKNIVPIIFVSFLYCISCSNQSNQIELSGFTMGTTYNIKIVTRNVIVLSPEFIKQKVDSILININYQMSAYLFDSEITQFNNHESTTSFTVSNDFAYVWNVHCIGQS